MPDGGLIFANKGLASFLSYTMEATLWHVCKFKILRLAAQQVSHWVGSHYKHLHFE